MKLTPQLGGTQDAMSTVHVGRERNSSIVMESCNPGGDPHMQVLS